MKMGTFIKKEESSKRDKPSPFNNTPLSYKEIDLITSVQGEIEGRISLPFIDLFSPIFNISVNEHSNHIEAIWSYTNIAMHLLLKENSPHIYREAASIYLIEAQRLLGPLFPLNDAFWKSFYLRQEKSKDRSLIALDAIYHLAEKKDHLSYEFAIQAVRVIVLAHYSKDNIAVDLLSNAHKIVSRLSSEKLKEWVKMELENRKK